MAKIFLEADLQNYIKKQIGFNKQFENRTQFAEHYGITISALSKFLNHGIGFQHIAEKLNFEAVRAAIKKEVK